MHIYYHIKVRTIFSLVLSPQITLHISILLLHTPNCIKEGPGNPSDTSTTGSDEKTPQIKTQIPAAPRREDTDQGSTTTHPPQAPRREDTDQGTDPTQTEASHRTHRLPWKLAPRTRNRPGHSLDGCCRTKEPDAEDPTVAALDKEAWRIPWK